MEIAAAATSPAQQASSLAGGNLAQNFDDFIMLLVAQLKNQDPLDPISTNEFTNQIVQFASVEQAIATNTNLERMIVLQRSNQITSAVGYLGKRIEAEGDTTALADGIAEWNYSLPENADSVGLLVADSTGRTVHIVSGATKMGAHQVLWNGLDQLGNPMEDGLYTLSVTALDRDGISIATEMTVVGVVSGIETSGDSVMLHVGSIGIPIDEVISILDTRPPQAEAPQG